jgi:glycosyltransferase involved in cell wall biosynthesis
MTKLGILTTHPIQYQVPWFRALAKLPDLDLTVFFCIMPNEHQQGDGFGKSFQWDIPLLEGYRYEMLENVASNPSLSDFSGCDTPGIDQVVRNGGYDAFIVNGWVVKSCVQLLWACRKYHVPCIVRGDSNNLRPRSGWKRLIHRLLLSRYSAFLYTGEGNRRFYLDNGVAENMLFFAPHCIDNERFAGAADTLRESRKEIRESWNIPKNAIVFLFCAKFIDKKRPMDILRALAQLQVGADARLGVHVLMVGTGQLLDACKAYVKQENLSVTFAGFLNQSEIAKAYVAADCQVLPSDHGETWGLVVNEGMACGIPAIVSDQVGCHLDLITPGAAGEVYPMGDVSALALKMGKLAANPTRLLEMGQAARNRISGYSYDRVVQGTLAALKHVERGN